MLKNKGSLGKQAGECCGKGQEFCHSLINLILLMNCQVNSKAKQNGEDEEEEVNKVTFTLADFHWENATSKTTHNYQGKVPQRQQA